MHMRRLFWLCAVRRELMDSFAFARGRESVCGLILEMIYTE